MLCGVLAQYGQTFVAKSKPVSRIVPLPQTSIVRSLYLALSTLPHTHTLLWGGGEALVYIANMSNFTTTLHWFMFEEFYKPVTFCDYPKTVCICVLKHCVHVYGMTILSQLFSLCYRHPLPHNAHTHTHSPGSPSRVSASLPMETTWQLER